MVIRQYIIYYEDTYGTQFFKKLYSRLKDEFHITCKILKFIKISGICYQKFTNQLKASLQNNSNIEVIIIADGDNKKSEIYNRIESHINEKHKDRSHVILFDYCIEEWICKSLGIKYSSKPVEALSKYIRSHQSAKAKYKKKELPNFVNKLNFQILLNNDEQFRAFYNTLSNC